MRTRTKVLVAGCGLAVAVATAGCGGAPPAAPAAAPTAEVAAPTVEAPSAPSAEASAAASSTGPISAGLVKIDGIAQQIVASIADTAKASGLAEQIEPNWSPIEDTVKANSADAYTSFEDAFSVLEDASKSGDATAAAKGAKAVSETVASYTSRYQG